MQTSNGQGISGDDPLSPKKNSSKLSKAKRSLSRSQLEFIDFIQFHGIAELTASLKKIHDLALYHSDVPFDVTEKTALFDLKMLWEKMEELRII